MAATRTRLRLLPPAWAQDVMLAAFVTFFHIRGTLLVAPPEQLFRLTNPGYLGYALLALGGLALLARRRWPIIVLAVIAVDSMSYYAAHYPDGPGWVGLFVALYTVTALGDGHRSVRIVTACLAVLTVVWLLTARLQPLDAAGWVFFRIGAGVMAAALGESVRTRGVLADEALERAARAERTREQEAQRRVDAERLRIAREVHDTVAHTIAVINIHAATIAHVLEKRPREAREMLGTIEQTSARALHELRATLGVLREVNDPRTPTPGLAQIDHLADVARDAGLKVTVEAATPPSDLPSALDQAAYRIVQESITNTIRHAGPAHVTIRITYGPDDLEIVVADDGVGPRHPINDLQGRGLIGMRERAGLLGGTLTTGPRHDGGFRVHALLPLRLDGR